MSTSGGDAPAKPGDAPTSSSAASVAPPAAASPAAGVQLSEEHVYLAVACVLAVLALSQLSWLGVLAALVALALLARSRTAAALLRRATERKGTRLSHFSFHEWAARVYPRDGVVVVAAAASAAAAATDADDAGAPLLVDIDAATSTQRSALQARHRRQPSRTGNIAAAVSASAAASAGGGAAPGTSSAPVTAAGGAGTGSASQQQQRLVTPPWFDDGPVQRLRASVHRPLFASAALEGAVRGFVGDIVNNFILVWYTKITEFTDEFDLSVRDVIFAVVRQLDARARHVDAGALLGDACTALRHHVRDYRVARAAVDKRLAQREVVDPVLLEDELVAELARMHDERARQTSDGAGAPSGALFPVPCTPEQERALLARITESILFMQLRVQERAPSSVRALLRDIIACKVLANLLNTLSNPFFLNKQIVGVIKSPAEERLEKHRKRQNMRYPFQGEALSMSKLLQRQGYVQGDVVALPASAAALPAAPTGAGAGRRDSQDLGSESVRTDATEDDIDDADSDASMEAASDSAATAQASSASAPPPAAASTPSSSSASATPAAPAASAGGLFTGQLVDVNRAARAAIEEARAQFSAPPPLQASEAVSATVPSGPSSSVAAAAAAAAASAAGATDSSAVARPAQLSLIARSLVDATGAESALHVVREKKQDYERQIDEMIREGRADAVEPLRAQHETCLCDISLLEGMLSGAHSHPVDAVSVPRTQVIKDDRPYAVFHVEVTGRGLKWTITRRFREFDLLDKRLKTDLGGRFKLELPDKGIFTFFNLEGDFLNDRRKRLQRYLEQTLVHPDARDHPAFLAFLRVGTPDDQFAKVIESTSFSKRLSRFLATGVMDEPAVYQPPSATSASGARAGSTGSGVLGTLGDYDDEDPQSASSGGASTGGRAAASPAAAASPLLAHPGASATATASGSVSGSAVGAPGAASASGLAAPAAGAAAATAAAATTAETLGGSVSERMAAASFTPPELEAVAPDQLRPVFLLVEELLRLEGGGFLRRNAYGAIRTMVQALAGDHMAERYQSISDGMVNEERIVRVVESLRNHMFPNGQRRVGSAPKPTARESHLMRNEAVARVFAIVPGIVYRLFGKENTQVCIREIMEMLQFPRVNRRLMTSILTIALVHVYPELQSADIRSYVRRGVQLARE